MIQFDVIGTGYSDPVLAEDEAIVTPAQALTGWRVNATARVPGWAQWLTSEAPLSEFSGVQTVCYVFPDRETHIVALSAYFEIAHTVKPVPAVVTMRLSAAEIYDPTVYTGLQLL